jgi:hypothetical protein
VLWKIRSIKNVLPFCNKNIEKHIKTFAYVTCKRGGFLLREVEDEDVVIPPVPSKNRKLSGRTDSNHGANQKPLHEHYHEPEELASTSVSVNYELPAFDEQELGVSHDGELQEELEQQKNEEEKPAYVQYSYDLAHKVIRASCLIALIAWFVIIVFLSIITDSSPFNTLIGLSPVMLTIIVTYIIVDKYHLESGFLMIFPLIFTGILFMLGLAHVFDNPLTNEPVIKYQLLSSVNIIFGLLFEAAVLVQYSLLRKKKKVEEKKEPEETKEIIKEIILETPEIRKTIVQLDDDQGLQKFVSSIEDKAKAINATIGRVYSVKHGGSENLRKKIKIDAEHYNEFNELKNEKPDKRRIPAIRLLRKIKERLELLQKPENEVFEPGELSELTNIERNKNGKEDIIDVLMKNDKDPVSAYYQGALDFCDEALKDLLEEKEK